MDSKTPPKKTSNVYLKCSLEALPNIAVLYIALSWMFFGDPAPTTVGPTFLWLAPILLSTLFSVLYLCVQDSGFGSLFCLFSKTGYEQAVLNTVRSAASACVLSKITTVVSYNIISSMISTLPPLQEENAVLWWSLFGALATLLFYAWALISCLIWETTVSDVEKVKEEMEARKQQGEYELEGLTANS